MAARKGPVKSQVADVFAAECPSRVILDHISSRWGVLVLLALRRGKMRFGEVRRVVNGVSEKMLSQTLSTLERDGFIKRTPHAVIPPRVDYELTELGESLAERVESLVRFVESTVGHVAAAQKTYDRRR